MSTPGSTTSRHEELWGCFVFWWQADARKFCSFEVLSQSKLWVLSSARLPTKTFLSKNFKETPWRMLFVIDDPTAAKQFQLFWWTFLPLCRWMELGEWPFVAACHRDAVFTAYILYIRVCSHGALCDRLPFTELWQAFCSPLSDLHGISSSLHHASL